MMQPVVLLVASLFALAAGWLWHARRRGLYPQRRVWVVLGVEALQVGAILLPAYPGGWPPVAMAVVLGTAAAREAGTTAGRAWPGRRWPACIAVLVVALGFAAYAWLARRPDGFAQVLLAYGIAEVHDVAAWLMGGACGRTPMAPGLSPGKTWEGEAAGVVAACTFAATLAWLLPAARATATLGWVAFMLAIGVGGDLLASYIKRLARQKDFAPWILTQGGVLDLYDTWVCIAPFAAAYHGLCMASP